MASRESSSAKAYGIQLYGFLVKTCRQRLRSPISTFSTIFIPFIFILLLGVCYWASDAVHTPEKWYSVGQGGITNTTFNISTISESFFCKHPASALNLVWSTCTFPPMMLTCMDNVGTGADLCIPTPMVSGYSGFLNSMYYYSGALTLNPMDSHLSISAFTQWERDNTDPTFFGRNGRESITHFGELLVASEDPGVATAFMEYCKTQSGMCSAVLNSHIFSSLDEAEKYALDHSDAVWAVLHLPSDLLTSEEDEVLFTIRMNYSATPWTFRDKVENLFSPPSAGSAPYILYWTSGFMTLQQFVQQFVLEQQLADKADLLRGPATYSSGTQGMSPFLNRWNAAVTPMPTPETTTNAFLSTWGYYLPLICALAALFPAAHLTALVVEEKSCGVREAMLIMGMHHTCMFSGWYVTSLLLDAIAALLVSMIFKLGFLSNVSYSVLFVLYFSFQQQNTALSLLISSLFSNPRIAGWCAALTIFVFAMPYYTFPPGMRDSAYWGASTVPCVGFAVSIGKLTSYVNVESEVGWHMARYGQFSVVDAIGMMWVSFAVMVLLALYLDRVWPAAVGRREHPLFFLRYLCCCCRKTVDPEPIALYDDTDDEATSQEEEATSPFAEATERSEDEGAGLVAGPGAGRRGRTWNKELIEHRDEVVDPTDESVPEAAVGRLVDFVRERGAPVHEHIREESAIQVVPPGCQLLGMERRGREVTFMFPLSFLSAAGKPMLEQLEASCGELRMRSDVFKATLLRQLGGPGAESRRLIDTAAAATRTAPGTCPYAAQAAAVCPFTGPPVAGTMVMPDTTKADAFGINKEENYEPASCLRFFRDFRALFLKRLHYAKRDGKLAPMQPAITLDMSLYADYKSNPSEVLVTRASMVPRANADAFAVASDLDNAALGSYYIAQVHDPAAGPPTISGVPQMNSLLSGAYYTHTSPRYIALSTTNFLVQSGPPHDTAVVLHNATYAHAAPQAINALYALALSQIFGSTHVAKPVVRNAPVAAGASLLGDSAFQFVMWATRILRVLPCVPFGEGLYVLAGTKMGTLMYPTTERSSLFGLLHFDESGRSIFKGGVGTGLIYMGCVTLVSTALLVVLEYVRVHHWTCCSRRSSDKSDAGTALTDTPDAVLPDLSVAEEEEREVQQRYDGGVRKAKKEEEGEGEERVHMLRTLLGRVQAYLEASLGEGSCAVDEVIGSGVKFVVRHNSVSDLCDVVMALTGSAVEGIPAVAYVGLAPPSMEDVLLAS
eukprot:gene862-496_t